MGFARGGIIGGGVVFGRSVGVLELGLGLMMEYHGLERRLLVEELEEVVAVEMSVNYPRRKRKF